MHVSATRPMAVYTPPSPIGDLISQHRQLMRDVYASHRAACGELFDTWTSAAALPRRKQRAA